MKGIQIERVQAMIEQLADYGRNADGSITRPSYGPAYLAAQEWLAEVMGQAGMEVTRDAVGNLTGTYAGQEHALPAVMTGSHLDTVPNGGRLDGALGIVAAIECVRSWQEAGWRPLRPVKVLATIEEEGSVFGLGCFGARAMAGEFAGSSPDDLQDKHGRRLSEYLNDQGLPSSALTDAIIDRSEYHSFLELHIEQGEELDLKQKPFALVTDIVGIDRHWITLSGQANHAGTTRMDRRRDALVAAACLIQQVYEAAFASNGGYVATIGTLTVSPGATNVIPGVVELRVETRAADNGRLEAAHTHLAALLEAVGSRYGVKGEISKRHTTPAMQLPEGVLQELRLAVEAAGFPPAEEMPSWAGHDAKILAEHIPSGMIFVPSIKGISHAREEETYWEAAAQGIEVLNQALKRLACQQETLRTGGK